MIRFYITFVLIFTVFGLFSQNYNNPNNTINTCSGNFYDSGGSGSNYGNNLTRTTTFCSNSSNCVVVDFSSFDIEDGWDYLYVYNGPTTGSPQIAGSPFTGTTSPGTVYSSSGCLTFRFTSDGSATESGWAASISCIPCPPAHCFNGVLDGDEVGINCGGSCPACPPENCVGGTTICSDNTFSGNSSGFGTQELSSSNDGCLSGEHQSSWYFFQASAAGTIEFTISPSNSADDYDFAVWGPYPSSSTPGGICPPSTTPLRCSYAAGGGDTGLQTGAGDNTEGSTGDKWINPINMNLGDVFILVIDNYSESNFPFDLNIDLSGGASLDCVPLPIELMLFVGEATESGNELQWQTMAEINNDYFVVEASKDASNFIGIGNIDGAGNSVEVNNYIYYDKLPLAATTYYRLKQVDFNGKFSYSDVISVRRMEDGEVIISPNPVKDVLNIEFKTTQAGNYNFIVVDLLGAVIEKNIHLNKGTNNIKLDVFADLPQGFYMLKIVDENNITLTTNKIVRKP